MKTKPPRPANAGPSRSGRRVGRGFAPLDLPVLIPRVKKRPSPRDPRGVVRETTPSNANKRRCTPTSVPFGSPSARGYARGGCVCAPCRPSAAVSVVRGESRRRSSTLAADFVGALRAVHMPKEKRGFGANKFARNPAALFLPAQSAISRSYFRFELRARADSPLPRQFARLRGRGDLRSLRWWRGAHPA